MDKLLKLKLVLVKNKRNGQVNMSIPRRQLPEHLRKDLLKFKKVNFFLEGFE